MATIWETPQKLFDNLNREFGFTLDVCALDYNAKCENYFSPEVDGLLQKWDGVCWCNPPFDKTMGAWIEKAFNSAQKGATVVCLFPGNYHDNDWWHSYVMRSSEIRYMRGRCLFHNNGKETSLRTLLVVFKPHCQGPPEVKSITRDGVPIKIAYNKSFEWTAKKRCHST